MIANPPHIVLLLRTRRSLIRHGFTSDEMQASNLALLFRKCLPHQPWSEFLETYHLYLQSIPLEIARAAWGINQARAESPTLTHSPS